MTTFLKILDANIDEKPETLRRMVRDVNSGATSGIYDVDAELFKSIPGSPFSYWISDAVRSLFSKFPPFEGGDRTAKVGLNTSDDFRFVRSWWELPATGDRSWVPLSKGGAASPFYRDILDVVRWRDDARELKAYAETTPGTTHWSRRLSGWQYYFRAGLTWPLRAGRFSASPLPEGCAFSVRGYSAFVERGELLSTLAVFNSSAIDYLFKITLGRAGHPEFVVGVLQKLPWANFSPAAADSLAHCAFEAWKHARRLHEFSETAHAFTHPKPLGGGEIGSRPQLAQARLDKIQRDLDAIVFEAFGFEDEDIVRIQNREIDSLLATVDDELADVTETLEGAPDFDGGEAATVSWSVGVAFGRFDVRLATGERATPPEPEPFDPLPAKSPGMLPDGDASFIPTSGVFVDDPGHADDLAARVTAVYERVGETPPAPAELRRALAKDFFPAHIRMYSKSRRKAPIYWQLATPSASYSVWLYIHAFSKDTLFRVQNDYMAPKLAHERRELEGLLAEARLSPTTPQSRAIEAQTTFVEELSALLDEVKRVAPLWDPDLDDGVILNFAPLWRLVPQNRAWQKELRAAWASLLDGDYDWAHLSMRLWPERVVPKCAKDRSLAIAHDLEDVFWVEGADGKWTARSAPSRSLEDLIAERTSPAIKAALASLIEAPEPAATARRRGRGAT